MEELVVKKCFSFDKGYKWKDSSGGGDVGMESITRNIILTWALEAEL